MHILPQPDRITAPYWKGTAQGELRLQHCRGCGNCWHPPLPRCPACASRDIEWRPAHGTGVLHTFTDIHHAVHAATADWVPYRVVLVDLDEGPRIVSGMDYEEREPEIGQRVRVVFKEMGNGVVLPYFERVPNT